MNLLEATSTLLDFVKTCAPENPQIRRAAKRMEKRMEVLQRRSQKERERRLWKAWDETCAAFHYRGIKCEKCGYEYDPVNFFECAEIDGRGRVKLLICHFCGFRLIGMVAAIDELDAQLVTDGGFVAR